MFEKVIYTNAHNYVTQLCDNQNKYLLCLFKKKKESLLTKARTLAEYIGRHHSAGITE